MVGEWEAQVVVTVLIVEGCRRWFRLPSWIMPYVVFPVAWLVVFITSLTLGVKQAVLEGLHDMLVVGVSAIAVYDVGGKPLKKLINKIRGGNNDA